MNPDPAPTTFETNGGRYIDLANPQPGEVSLLDISTSLANQCRFLGHVKMPYSIAEHAILTMHLVYKAGRPDLALAALHHDSHEAYIGDITTPTKRLIEQKAPGVLREIADRIDDAIAARFGIDADHFKHPVVKEADQTALRMEAYRLKTSLGVGDHWGYDEPLRPRSGQVCGMDQPTASYLFKGYHFKAQARLKEKW